MKKTIATIDLRIGYRRRTSGYNGAIMRRLNLSAASGELVVVAGLNGVGKSTLLRTLAGLQKQVDGKILLCGKPVSDYSRNELARVISFVSTETVNVPYLKVFDLAAMGRYPYTSHMGRLSMEDRFRVFDALELVGLRAMAFRNVNTLSDGERQRVMIARTLIQDTPIVLFDEPTAYLDIPNKYEMLALLRQLAHQQHKTIIYSTHDLILALRTADKVWLLHNAHIYEGAPEDSAVLSTVYELFNGSHLMFNYQTGEITPKISLDGAVSVVTKNDAGRIRHAMTRWGYDCIVNPREPIEELPKIDLALKKAQVDIIYTFKGITKKFHSFYELGAFLRQNPPPPLPPLPEKEETEEEKPEEMEIELTMEVKAEMKTEAETATETKTTETTVEVEEEEIPIELFL